jgi:4-amino-4-deoxy-L-arabinose transferase-like glycosyltransferase
MSRRKALQPEVPPLSPLPPPKSVMSRGWTAALVLAVAVYLALGVGHLRVTPVLPNNAGSLINAPDEAAHLEYIRVVAEERRLPLRGGSTYEWHQPPLYYVVASPLYGFGPAAVRGLSLFLGLLSVLIVFQSARRLFPNDPPLAVLSAGFCALLPMRQAVSASAGNDALLELLFSLTLLQLIGAFTHGFTPRRAALLGITLGAAMLTKASAILLIPVIAAALFLMTRQGEARRAVLQGGMWIVLIAAALSAPWFMRNVQQMGSLTPVSAFMKEFELTRKAADWIGESVEVDVWTGDLRPGEPMSRLGYEAFLGNWTFRTFFGSFTRPNVARNGSPNFLPPEFYLAYALMTAASLLGVTLLHFRRRAEFSSVQLAFVTLFILTFALVLTSFLAFTWHFFQAQGRYLYPALLPISILFSLGIRAVMPVRYRTAGTAALLVLFAVLAFGFYVQGVVPAYSEQPFVGQPVKAAP